MGLLGKKAVKSRIMALSEPGYSSVREVDLIILMNQHLKKHYAITMKEEKVFSWFFDGYRRWMEQAYLIDSWDTRYLAKLDDSTFYRRTMLAFIDSDDKKKSIPYYESYLYVNGQYIKNDAVIDVEIIDWKLRLATYDTYGVNSEYLGERYEKEIDKLYAKRDNQNRNE